MSESISPFQQLPYPDQAPLIALVIPVFNEAEQIKTNLLTLFNRLDALSGNRFEIIVVDDGSTDLTRLRLLELQQLESRLSLIGFARNFGKEAAILAGLKASLPADATVVMDSDLQHPPELLGPMLEIWKQGIPVVEAVKTHRGKESLLNRLFAHGFYWIFGMLAGLSLQGQTDFKLLDRRVVEAYLSLPERARFFRGLVPWLGFNSAQIPFVVPERSVGSTRWTHWRLCRYAITAITTFSAKPLQFITVLGLFLLMVSVLVTSKVLYDQFTGIALDGFATVILLQLLLGGVLMVGIGLLGIYVARLHEEVKARPPYVIGWHSRVTTLTDHAPREHTPHEP